MPKDVFHLIVYASKMENNLYDETYFDQILLKKKSFLAGCDEVGRGPLAGPVVAASALVFINPSVANKRVLRAEFRTLVIYLRSLGVTKYRAN